MRKIKLISLALYAAAWLASGSVWAQSVPAQDSNGWYLLGTVDDVEWFGQQVMVGKHSTIKGKLTADIDYEGVVNRHQPIGNFGQKFVGKFDGQGHRILNMVLNDPTLPKGNDDGTGFFGCVRVGGDGFIMGSDSEKETNDLVEIKNLIIDASCSITSSRANTAGLVGRISEKTTGYTVLIENCVNEATINTTAAAPAGIVGQINNAADGNVIIRNCVNKGTVTTSGLAAAGIISQVNNCAVKLNIESCMNLADVKSTGNKNCGGIHGANTSSKGIIKIKNCGNTGNVTGTDESAALTGWIGSNAGNEITNCWNIGSVTGVKGPDNTYRGTVTVSNVYDINGGQGTLITNEMVASGELCYNLNSDQSVISWTQTLDGTQDMPLPNADGDQVYMHGQLNCDGTSAPGTMYDNNGPDGVIQIPHNISDEMGMCSVCHTQFQEPALVDGYYELKNAGNVEWFSAKVAGGDLTINGKMMNDIDFYSIENLHSPIGPNTANKYNGTFDGQGFRIKNLIIERPSDSNIGFFGFLRGNNANTTVKNFIMDASCTIHGYNRVGGITGSCQNNGTLITLENIINEATVIAEHQDAAGIIGGQEGNGPKWLIRNVLNLGTVTAKNEHPYAGALCCYLGGNGESVIENFVNLGTINGHEGGNIGRIAGTYTNIIDLSDTDPAGSTASGNIGFETGLTKADIASGKLAYTVGWWQEIGVDAYPTPFEKDGATVYRTGYERCDGADIAETVYSNTDGTIEANAHDYNGSTGFCDICSLPNPGFKALVDGAYELGSVIDVKWFEAMVNTGNPAINGNLTDDLDFDGGSCRIGNGANSYCGTFKGNDHVISNFNITTNTESVQGFFGWITGGADISGLIFDNSCSISCVAKAGIIGGARAGGTVKLTRLGNEGNVTTTNENAAGIIGTDDGSSCVLLINQCYSTGTIAGGKESAQIAGWTGASSKITNSWSCAAVTGVQTGREFSRYGGDAHDAQYENCFTTYHETNKGLTYDTPMADFGSGKVAYATGFGQNIGTDAYPGFFGPEVLFVGTAGYTTFYDSANDWKLNGDAQAYIGTISGNYLNLGEIDDIPAGTAVVIGGTYYNKLSTTATASTTGNILLGSDGTQKGGTGIYALANGTKGVGFYPVGSEVTIPKGKAYLTAPTPVKEFYGFDYDDATGIEMVNGQSSMVNGHSIYDLSGRRINSQFTIHNSQLPKGIYIVNGKKILK